MEQIETFLNEARALHALLKPLTENKLEQKTSFKGWSINEIIRHLYVWNKAAQYSASDKVSLTNFLDEAVPFVLEHDLRTFEANWTEGLKGVTLVETWWNSCLSLQDTFKDIEPKTRLKWAGPSMSARSSITARIMETWSHSQAIYDVLQVQRTYTGSLKDIAQLGVQTFGWTFINRKQDVPSQTYVKLTGPDGDEWTWGTVSETNAVIGNAQDFCHVVTQSRNIKDTSLLCIGEAAEEWMKNAQCFAGPPENPPRAGSRVAKYV
jgi:uncharacterized protein (TIGR03084 family)